ncbi:MAG: hypothetical protein WAO98_02025 [Alphaproteobacteria bacterium]
MRYAHYICLGLLLGLTACTGVATTKASYTLPSNPGGRVCTSQCNEARHFCAQNCDLDHRRCIMNVQSQAMQDYERYTREQFAIRGAVELRPRDFERSAPCDADKKSCSDNCESHYQPCYEGCGGKIETISSCQFFCF